MNDIPVELFILFWIFQFVIMAYALITNDDTRHTDVIAGVLSSIMAFILSQSIINGTVYVMASDGTKTLVQSLPIHYFILGLGIFMSVATVVVIITKFSSPDPDDLETGDRMPGGD